jgi:elongator complex protein 2
MVRVETEYISVGGNRHPGAADWDVRSGVLAYGADNNVALWAPKVYLFFSLSIIILFEY